jgi:hypothetical protein
VIVVVAIVLVGGIGFWWHGRAARPLRLVALDSRTGHQIWMSELPALGISRLTDTGRSVDVAGWAEYSHCVFGARNFRLDASGKVLGERSPVLRAALPVTDGDTTYVAAYQSPNVVVTARDRVTKGVRWSINLAASDIPDLNAGSGVLIVSQPGEVGFSVLDGADGKPLWAVTTGDSHAVAGGGDHRVYVIEAGRVVARDSDSGAAQWRVAAPDRADPDVPVVVGSSPTRVVIARGNRLIVYDQDGRKVARAQLPGGQASGVFPSGDRVYAAIAGTPSRGSCD